MTTRHHGSCLCGAVRFEVEGSFERFFLCHCSFCRKDTGSAHAANLFSTTAKLTWLAGENQVTTYNLPSTRHAKSFCATCGSALPRLHAGTHELDRASRQPRKPGHDPTGRAHLRREPRGLGSRARDGAEGRTISCVAINVPLTPQSVEQLGRANPAVPCTAAAVFF